jgi:hypothetical protein
MFKLVRREMIFCNNVLACDDSIAEDVSNQPAKYHIPYPCK